MDEVEIEGAPIQDLYLALMRLMPIGVIEICHFPVVWDEDNTPVLDARIVRRRRSHDWIPLTLEENEDGGRYIQIGVEGIELHLDERAALDFISFIRRWRKSVERFRYVDPLDSVT